MLQAVEAAKSAASWSASLLAWLQPGSSQKREDWLLTVRVTIIDLMFTWPLWTITTSQLPCWHWAVTTSCAGCSHCCSAVVLTGNRYQITDGHLVTTPPTSGLTQYNTMHQTQTFTTFSPYKSVRELYSPYKRLVKFVHITMSSLINQFYKLMYSI